MSIAMHIPLVMQQALIRMAWKGNTLRGPKLKQAAATARLQKKVFRSDCLIYQFGLITFINVSYKAILTRRA